MNSKETLIRRREAEIKTGQEDLARALTRSLVLLHFKGNCKCGLMLTEQDKDPRKESYCCPHCGKSTPLTGNGEGQQEKAPIMDARSQN
jgi:hypothetical protein